VRRSFQNAPPTVNSTGRLRDLDVFSNKVPDWPTNHQHRYAVRNITGCGLSVLCCLVGLSFPAAPGRAQSFYAIENLGTLGGNYSAAFGLNHLGHVVGESTLTNFEIRAFRWSNGQITNLGSLGGPFSTATDINDAGNIAGYSEYTNTTDDRRAFMWSNGVLISLGTLGGAESWAESINDTDDVAGRSKRADLFIHAFMWKHGQMRDLGIVTDDPSEGYGINNSTQVVGFSGHVIPLSSSLPAYWMDLNGNTNGDPGEMVAFSALGGRYGRATAINNIGQIVGGQATNYTEGEFPRNAFLWHNEAGVNIGRFSGHNYAEALDINDAGTVVGYSGVHPEKHIAFRFQNQILVNLNTLIDTNLGWQLRSAEAINNSGQIAGFGVISGATRAFLLTPATTSVEMAGAQYDTGAGAPLVVWRGSGSNLTYTLENSTSLNIQAWHVVEPTNQWPSSLTFYQIPSDSPVSQMHFRVRAQSGAP
jgi:probable HAF family extracellular repeat protein